MSKGVAGIASVPCQQHSDSVLMAWGYEMTEYQESRTSFLLMGSSSTCLVDIEQFGLRTSFHSSDKGIGLFPCTAGGEWLNNCHKIM